MSDFFSFSTVHQKFFQIYGEKLTYKKGNLLVRGSDPAPWVFFLQKGIIKVTFSSADGTERLLGFFLPGMTFAQSGSFFSDPSADLQYESIESTVVYRVPKEKFLKELSENHEFKNDYLQMIAKNNIYLIERIVYQGESGIRMKFLRWLIFMIKYYGKSTITGCEVLIPLTHTEIANFLHTTRESVNKVINEYRQEKLLTIKDKRITVYDKKSLLKKYLHDHHK